MLFVVGLLLGCVFAKPFPSFPSAYHVELSMKLPQWEGGFGLHVAQPVRAWYDADKGERLEYWSRSGKREKKFFS
jgi:hypothetical protein